MSVHPIPSLLIVLNKHHLGHPNRSLAFVLNLRLPCWLVAVSLVGDGLLIYRPTANIYTMKSAISFAVLLATLLASARAALLVENAAVNQPGPCSWTSCLPFPVNCAPGETMVTIRPCDPQHGTALCCKDREDCA